MARDIVIRTCAWKPVPEYNQLHHAAQAPRHAPADAMRDDARRKMAVRPNTSTTTTRYSVKNVRARGTGDPSLTEFWRVASAAALARDARGVPAPVEPWED